MIALAHTFLLLIVFVLGIFPGYLVCVDMILKEGKKINGLNDISKFIPKRYSNAIVCLSLVITLIAYFLI